MHPLSVVCTRPSVCLITVLCCGSVILAVDVAFSLLEFSYGEFWNLVSALCPSFLSPSVPHKHLCMKSWQKSIKFHCLTSSSVKNVSLNVVFMFLCLKNERGSPSPNCYCFPAVSNMTGPSIVHHGNKHLCLPLQSSDSFHGNDTNCAEIVYLFADLAFQSWVALNHLGLFFMVKSTQIIV